MSFRDQFYSIQEALGLTSAFLSINGFIVYFYRTNKKQQRKMSPLKTTFLCSMFILIVLVIIALISMFIGYRQAATVAAVMVNGTLVLLIL